MITVEADDTNPPKNRGVIDILAAHDYEYVGHVTQNDWFVRKGFEPSTETQPWRAGE